MKRERIWQFLEAYRDGVIDEAAATDLAHLIRNGGEDADWVLEELAFSGWVQQALEELDEAGFVRSFLERLKAERGEDDFTRAFSQRLAVETQKIKKQVAEESRLKMPFRHFLASHTDDRSGMVGAAGRRRWLGGWLPWLVAAGLILIVCGGLYVSRMYARQPAVVGVQKEFSPGVTIWTGDVRGAIDPGKSVYEGQSLHVPPNGHAVFSDNQGGQWRLHSGSQVLFISAGGQADHLSLSGAAGIFLQTGKIDGDISTMGKGVTFVTTPHATVEFNGPAVFSLSATAGSTFAEVKKGKCVITRKADGRTIELRSGHYAMVADGADFEPLEK